jgi:hypothetical protein
VLHADDPLTLSIRDRTEAEIILIGAADNPAIAAHTQAGGRAVTFGGNEVVFFDGPRPCGRFKPAESAADELAVAAAAAAVWATGAKVDAISGRLVERPTLIGQA